MATSVKYAVQEEGVTPLRIVLGFLVVLLTGVLAGCFTNVPQEGIPFAIDTLAPPPCPSSAAPTDTTELGACLQGLQFDAVAAVGDEQRLLVRDTVTGPGDTLPACHGDTTHSCRYGPLAKIEPVKETVERDTAALNQGVIIAKLFLRSGETESYPKLGLVPNDTTYWWIKRLSATTALSMYFRRSGDSVVPTPLDTITIELHPPGTFKQGLARFIWHDDDETTQGRCGSGCCKP
jgi:hypothetical protein